MGATTVLRIVPPGAFGSRRSVHMLERNALIYKKGWYFLVSGFFEPLFYLLSLGIGLNHLIGVVHVGTTVVTYSAFVAPGMLATSAMNGSMTDATFTTFFRLKVDHTYDSVMATPLSVEDIAFGELSWCLTRGSLYSMSFLVCMWALGDTLSPWAILCLPVAILTPSRSRAPAWRRARSCGAGRTSTSSCSRCCRCSSSRARSSRSRCTRHGSSTSSARRRCTRGSRMARACNFGIFDWSFLGHFVYLATCRSSASSRRRAGSASS